jgi:hypothetical protein
MALDRMRSVKAVWYLATAPFSAPLDFKLRSSFNFFSRYFRAMMYIEYAARTLNPKMNDIAFSHSI